MKYSNGIGTTARTAGMSRSPFGRQTAEPAAPSYIQTQAEALSADSYVELSTDLDVTDLKDGATSTLTWSDSCGYDPINKKIRMICKKAGSGIYHRVITYDFATNSFSIDVDDGTLFPTNGHGYDGNTCDPATGDHYFLPYNSRIIKKLSGGTWTSLSQSPNVAVPAQSIEWLDNSPYGAGLLHVGGGNVGCAFYNGSWAWSINTSYKVGGVGWGAYHHFAKYNPVHDCTLIGGGNEDSGTGHLERRTVFRLDNDFTFNLLGEAPFDLTMSTDNPADVGSLVSVDTTTGDYLIYNFALKVWWRFDAINDVWTEITSGGPPTHMDATYGAVQCPIPDLGVIFILSVVSDTPYCHIYKP